MIGIATWTRRFLIPAVSAIISGYALAAIFPPFSISYLAWICLVPLFIISINRNLIFAFLLWLICSIVFYMVSFAWIREVTKFQIFHYLPLLLYYSSYLAIFGLLFGFLCRRLNWQIALVASPFLWVSIEFLRANFTFLALPWGLMAHSQYELPLITQMTSITGAYGLSFLIVWVNAGVAAALYPNFLRPGNLKSDSASAMPKNPRVVFIGSAAACLLLVIVYGFVKISEPIKGREIKLAMVQGNIEQSKKWDPKYAKQIMQTYADLTRQAASFKPDLILWPETATPRSITYDRKLFIQVKNIAKSAGSHILVGSSQLQKLNVKDPKSAKYFNSAFLISPNSKRRDKQRYDKIRLFPFGEYLPFKKTIPWTSLNVPQIGDYLVGDKHTVIKLKDFQFGVTICWENIFPDLFRQFVKNGAQVMLNLTNEAWFGKSAAADQFVAMNIFRAVENRVFIARCTNTGISCIIDPYGRVVEHLKDADGRDIFIQGVLTGSVIPSDSLTFYTRYGDWPPVLCIVFTLVLLVLSLIRKSSSASHATLERL